MNKFTCILLALAVCGPIMALSNPLTNSELEVDNLLSEMEEQDEGTSYAGADNGFDEAANLPEEHAYFRDYCLDAQGTIKNYVSEKLNGAAANIYSIMLTSATDIGREVLTAQRSSVEEGTKLIEQAQSQNGGEPATEEEIQENLQKAGIFKRVTAAVKSVIMAILETARATLFSRVQELKEQLGSEGLKQKIEDACMSISNELQPRLNRQLTEAKTQIKSVSASDNEKLNAILAGARVDNIGCTLTGRISKVAKFCDILKVAGPTVYQLVGIN